MPAQAATTTAYAMTNAKPAIARRITALTI
jgi:hypothetical protein